MKRTSYQWLTIMKKLEIVDRVEGLPLGKKRKDIAAEYGIPCSTLSTILKKQVIRVEKTRGAAAPRTRITCTSFLSLEEPSLKLLRLSELQCMNSSPISNCWHSKSAIFISHNINYNINSLLLLRVGIRIIYLSIYLYIYLSIGRALHTGSRNENNIGAASLRESHLFGSLKKKRQRDPTKVDVDEALFQWFTAVRTQLIPISGEVLKTKAEELNKEIDCWSEWTCFPLER